MKKFFEKEFEFGGTLQNPDHSKGNYMGVYIITLPGDFGKVDFENESKLKLFKGRKVAVAKEELQKKWVESAEILYIGRSLSTTVHDRVFKQHVPFWNGKNVAAYGGRIIGQMQNWNNLEAWYLKCDDPAKIEKDLLNEFKARYGKLPYANWRV